MKPFSDADSGLHLISDLAEGVITLRRDRFLEPRDVVGGEAVRKADRRRDVVEGVRIDQDFDIRANRFANRSDDVDALLLAGRADVAVQIAGPGPSHLFPEWIGLDGVDAVVDRNEGVSRTLLGCRGVREVGVEGD